MAARRKTKSRSKHNGSARREPDAPGPAKPGKRPVWQGSLRLSLVSCPVALYTATSHAADVSFHLINPETHNRIRMVPTDPESGPVERGDLVKGYEIEKDRYVVVTNEELDEVKLETTRTLDIERFVNADEIDRLFWNDPYYLVPDGKEGEEAYTVIRAALEQMGRVALGRVVMHARERLVAIEPRDKGMIVTTLRMRNELVEPSRLFDDIPQKKVPREMLSIAEKIIEQKEGRFEPEEFKDRYEAALRDLIRRKEKGEKPVMAPPPEESNVIDLMDALKKSLKNKGQAPARATRTSSGKRRQAR
jgi:DNA end-binding protein Ku